MKQTDDLVNFWNKLKESTVTLKDIDQLEIFLGKIFLKMKELEESRNRWKEKCNE
jgi:hypothetical protein